MHTLRALCMNCCSFFLPSSFFGVTPAVPGDMGLPVPLPTPGPHEFTSCPKSRCSQTLVVFSYVFKGLSQSWDPLDEGLGSA